MSEPDTWTLRLPWTKPPLTLNQRGHWAGRSRVIREVRNTARILARHAQIPACPRIHAQLVYVPRDKRTRDQDNLVATLKPLLDGLRDAHIVPDDDPTHVAWTPPRIDPPNGADPHLYLVITRLDAQETP